MKTIADTVEANSQQLNADDLIGRTLTITVTKVALSGSAEQPIDVHFEDDHGKPYKPCKSMRRVMIHVWGNDGNAYVGRSMTLFRDPSVKFGGMEVGGIRISHMSHISEPVVMPLTVTRGSKKAYKVLPLAEQKKSGKMDARGAFEALIARLPEGAAARVFGSHGYESLDDVLGAPKPKMTEIYKELEGFVEQPT